MADEKLKARIKAKYVEYRNKGFSHFKARNMTADLFCVSVQTVEETTESSSYPLMSKSKKLYHKPPKLVIKLIQDEVIAYRRVLLDLGGDDEKRIRSELVTLEDWLKEVDG